MTRQKTKFKILIQKRQKKKSYYRHDEIHRLRRARRHGARVHQLQRYRHLAEPPNRPRTKYKIAGTVKKGTTVCVVSTSNGWSKLSTGKYCSSSYLSKKSGSSGSTSSGTTKCKGFDADKAVKTLKANAHAKSIGYCAKYTKLALQAGGIPYAGCNATDCEPYLLRNGFKVISNNKKLSSYKKGDVVLFFKTKKHIYGHMEMWSGEQWISDFRQRSFSPYSDTVPFKIYRYSC